MNRSLLTLVVAFALVGCGERGVFGYADGDVADGSSTDGGRADAAGSDGGRDAGAIRPGDDAGPGSLDAGDDAGSIMPGTDAGPGTLDAGRDAGSSDAGSSDAGSFDAGSFDSGSSDAGSSDAGRDAATLDSSVGDAAHLGPRRVELGPVTDLAQAGAYVLIGATGITNVTGSMISGGHLGVSPVGASSITGFSLILDSSGQFSTSSSVVAPAKVYAADYAVPTPTNLTSAVLSMQAGYTDAASRPTPDFLNLSSGNLGGLTLVPGLYTWGSTVTIPSNVTIAGGSNDVWIFQITGDVDVSPAVQVLTSGGASAANIFWQVSGNVTIHAGAHFEGIILCQTGITLQTGASMRGRALAQSLVALDDNAITAP